MISTHEEQALVALKQFVSEGEPPTGNSVRASRRFGWKPRIAVTTMAAALVAAGAILLAQPTTSAAYTVTSRPDGTVRVTIKSFVDPSVLQKSLEEAGVPAVVQLRPLNGHCKEPWFTSAGNEPEVFAGEGSLGGRGSAWSIDIRKSKLRPGEVVLVELGQQVSSKATATSVMTAVAKGKVNPCVPVIDPAPRPGPTASR